MAKKNSGSITDTLPQAGEGTNVKGYSVAFYDGPDEIGFCGKNWQRAVAQTVTAEEWAGMRAHPHFGHFDFQVKE